MEELLQETLCVSRVGAVGRHVNELVGLTADDPVDDHHCELEAEDPQRELLHDELVRLSQLGGRSAFVVAELGVVARVDDDLRASLATR